MVRSKRREGCIHEIINGGCRATNLWSILSDYSNSGCAYGKAGPGQSKLHRSGSVDSTDHADANAVTPAKPPKSNAAAQVQLFSFATLSDIFFPHCQSLWAQGGLQGWVIVSSNKTFMLDLSFLRIKVSGRIWIRSEQLASLCCSLTKRSGCSLSASLLQSTFSLRWYCLRDLSCTRSCLGVTSFYLFKRSGTT